MSGVSTTAAGSVPIWTDAQQRVITALGESCVGSGRWRVSAGQSFFSERPQCSVGFRFPKDAPGPGIYGLHGDLKGQSVALKPDSSMMEPDIAEFWEALSDRPVAKPSCFDGFAISVTELMPLLNQASRAEMVVGLRLKAAFYERVAFENTRNAKPLRALIAKHDSDYCCTVKISAHEYRSADETVRILKAEESPGSVVGEAPRDAWIVLGRRSGRERQVGGVALLVADPPRRRRCRPGLPGGAGCQGASESRRAVRKPAILNASRARPHTPARVTLQVCLAAAQASCSGR